MTGKSREKYNTHRVSKQSDKIDFSATIFEDSVSVDGRNYLLIKGGGRIDKKNKKIFVFVKTGQAPDECVCKFERLTKLSKTKIQKMKNAYH